MNRINFEKSFRKKNKNNIQTFSLFWSIYKMYISVKKKRCLRRWFFLLSNIFLVSFHWILLSFKMNCDQWSYLCLLQIFFFWHSSLVLSPSWSHLIYRKRVEFKHLRNFCFLFPVSMKCNSGIIMERWAGGHVSR